MGGKEEEGEGGEDDDDDEEEKETTETSEVGMGFVCLINTSNSLQKYGSVSEKILT